MPCPANPADGDGQAENWDGSNTCAGNNRGIVPWATIGLAERDVVDQQGNYITYIVNASDSMEVCNGSSARASSLDDLNSTTNAKFALVSHGENGFGAYGKDSSSRKDAPSSAQEIANCPVPNGGNCNGTTVPNTNAFRSGPASDDDSTYFDDIVKSVQMDASVTAECKEFFGEDPVSAGTNGTREVVQRTFQRTQNSSANQLNQPSVSEIDPDGQADTGDELIALRFQNNDTFASAACAHQESTYPLEGHTIRVYSKVAFKSEVSSGSDQGSGNGIVFGFAGHKQTDDNVATSVTNTDCGGTDQYMGFMDEVGRALASNVERFGLEIDTYRHLGDTGPYAAGDIFDPTSNHIAIITGDVDHEGSETFAEGEQDNSPVCRSDLDTISGGPFGEHGTPADERVNGTWPGGTNAKNTDQDGEACLRHASDPDWLEDGDPFRDGVSNQLHDVRIELHDHGNDDCPAGEFQFLAWVWGNSDADNNCATYPCNDVQNDFDNGDDDREPHVKLCIQANRASGEADLEAVRFFLANGFPVRAGTASQRNDLSVADFKLGFTRVDGASKSDGGDDAAIAVIEENDIRSYLNLGTGNINTDQAYARDDTEGVNIFSDEGPFRLDEDDGLGVDGVGANTLLDTIDPSNTGSYPDADGEYLDVNEREKIVFEFDDLWARFTVNIRDFGDSDNGGYTGSDLERIRLRAFNGTSQIGNDVDVTACAFNAGSAGTDRAMVINTDFGMDISGNERFDRVQVIPMPIDSEDPEAHTRVLAGGALACGQNRPCSFDRTDSSDNNRNYSEFRCHQLLTDRPTSSGSGETDEIQPEAANNLMGLGDNVNEATTRSWIDFNNYPEDGSDLDVQILSENGTIRSQDNAGETTVGFGVTGTGTSGTLLDTVSNPTGSETDVEELRFLFDQDWQRLNIGITRFGLQANGGNDQVQIAFHNNGSETAVHTLTLSPCAGADTNNNWRKDALIDVQSLAGSVFDEVRVRPLQNTGSGDRQTQVYVRTLKACDAIAGCDLEYGDENAGQAARYCTESIS